MKFVQGFGVAIFLSSVSVLLAQGFGPKKEDAPKFLKQLSSANAAERAKGAEMLGKLGGINATYVDDAVEPLKKSLEKDKDAKVRAASARALGNIHPEAEGVVSLLVDRIKSTSEVDDVKMASVVALGQFGADAKEAIPALREFGSKFTDKKSKNGQTIMTAIQMINGAKKKKN